MLVRRPMARTSAASPVACVGAQTNCLQAGQWSPTEPSTYLGGLMIVTGGLGALGALVAAWLSWLGACDLLLLGRSGRTSEDCIGRTD